MENSSDIRKKSISGIKWGTIEKFSVQGVQFVIGIILARILSPSDFGIIALLTVFIAISQTFIDSGFSSALIRKKEQTEVDFSTAFYFNIAVGVLCFLVIFVSAPYIAAFYDMPILIDVSRVLAVTLVLNSFTIVQSTILTIRIDFKTLANINFFSAVISGVLGIYLAYIDWGVWALVSQAVAYSFFRFILYLFCLRWMPRLVFSIESFKYLFSFGGKLLASSLVHTVYSNITPIVIGKFYTPKDLGYYDRGRQFGSLPSSYIVQIFERVSMPILAQVQEKKDDLVLVYRKYIKASSIVVFFVMALVFALAKPIVLLVLTDKWYDAIIYLQLICVAEMFNHVSRLNLVLLQVVGRSDLFLRLEIIKKLISFSLLLISVPFGIIMICISQIVYSQIALFINTYYTKKLFGLSYLYQVKDFSIYLLCAVVASVPAFVLVLFDLPSVLCLVIGSISAFVLYAYLLRRNAEFVDIRETLLNMAHINHK